MPTYLRVNYRTTGNAEGQGIMDELDSVIIVLCTSIQHDSATGNVCTITMSGYGSPVMCAVLGLASEPAANALTFAHYRTSIPGASSLVYVSFMGDTGSYGSLAATVTVAYHVLALIGSR